MTESSSTISHFTLAADKLQSFADDGYLLVRGAVDAQRLSDLYSQILAEFARVKLLGQLFEGGGNVSGHLNCFPGEASRFVYDSLRANGVLDAVQTLSREPLRMPNVGCNLNLPGSSEQNDHVDGYAAKAFLVVNIAAVDTDLTNGAMEVLPGTHRKTYKYWQLLLDRPERQRVCMRRGDVLIRTSALWHRGMPNASSQARPMLALSYEDGGSTLDDPYRAHGGQITFLPNRYATNTAGRWRERAFVAAPRLGTAFRVVRSIFETA